MQDSSPRLSCITLNSTIFAYPMTDPPYALRSSSHPVRALRSNTSHAPPSNTPDSTRKSHSASPSALADSWSTQLHTLPGIPKGLLRRIPLRLPLALRYEHLNI